MIRIGVVGFGYWGPNVVRNFLAPKDATVTVICDPDDAARRKAAHLFPQCATTADYREVAASASVDAVAVVTPVAFHFEVARAALLNGKDVFVEKPFTAASAEAEELVSLAEQKQRIVMVDHTFLFTPSVRAIKRILDNKELGSIYYYDSTRVNLGLLQHDVNVIWDLAAHDFAILDHVIGDAPSGVAAHGVSHFGNGLEDVAYVSVYFGRPLIAHFSVNWLSPVKIRQTLIGGDRKMLLWNDLAADEKIKIYDRGVDVGSPEGRYRLLVSYRSGDMLSPMLENREALRTEAEYFVECVSQGKPPHNDGRAGLRIVRLLEATTRSLRRRGEIVPV